MTKTIRKIFLILIFFSIIGCQTISTKVDQATKKEEQEQEYESEGDAGVNGNLEEFFASTRGRFKTATGERWSAEIEARRPSTTTKTTSD